MTCVSLCLKCISQQLKQHVTVQFCGKSMQGGALAACISVKVTVDFCCTVPFLIGIATIAHSSLSLYFCFSASFSLALSHTVTPLPGKIQIWFLVLLSSLTLCLCPCQALCLACICHLWQPGRCSSKHQTKHCSCQKQLSFRELYKNQTAIILCCSLTIWRMVFNSQIINIFNVMFRGYWCRFQIGLSMVQRVHSVVGCSKICCEPCAKVWN